MRGLRGAARLQLQTVASDREYLNDILTNPFFAIIFLGVVRAAGRSDLTSFALVAPVLMTLWSMSLEISGSIVDADRSAGVLENVFAAPTPFGVVVVGRVLAVSLVGTIAIAETWLVARVGFGVELTVHHPEVFAATILLTALALTGTALFMAGAFVLAGGARMFQNTMNYPIFLLAGVLAPISFLPQWLHPVSRLLFLSWSADLLRASFEARPPGGVGTGLVAIVVLGLAASAAGWVALRVVESHVRRLGTLGDL